MSSSSITITLSPDEVDSVDAQQREVAEKLECSVDDVTHLKLRKKSLDARRGRVRFHLTFDGDVTTPPPSGALENPFTPASTTTHPHKVVIVGTGPAGLFCALELRRLGLQPVVVERGKQVQPRRKDLKGLNQLGIIDEDSNYCFGEGGAGTYSDGKLYTRATKRGDIRTVLETLVHFGAPDRVLTDARPHIGSNKLPKVIAGMRQRLLDDGVQFAFETRFEGLVRHNSTVAGARLRDLADDVTRDEEAAAVVLATGHSARDIYRLLDDEGIAIEAKPFALGVRVEHPQPLINRIQYGKSAGHPALMNAAYSLTTHVDDRAVHSFCMCPGGFIVPAATEKDGLVVNGMSLSRRDSPFANSGMVVQVTLDDIAAAGFEGPLAAMQFQAAVERAGFESGERGLRAPAVRVADFMQRRLSTDLPDTSYQPGLVSSELYDVLDVTGVRIADRLGQAMLDFDRKLKGYLSPDAVFIGVESRTSAPVRIPRDDDTFMSPSVQGLFPTGEGAGYAGGIMSAALDGMRVARKVAASLGVDVVAL